MRERLQKQEKWLAESAASTPAAVAAAAAVAAVVFAILSANSLENVLVTVDMPPLQQYNFYSEYQFVFIQRRNVSLVGFLLSDFSSQVLPFFLLNGRAGRGGT